MQHKVRVEVGKSCEIGYYLAVRGINNPPKQAEVAAFLFAHVRIIYPLTQGPPSEVISEAPVMCFL